jgi:ketosteroid isomerase-like protein
MTQILLLAAALFIPGTPIDNFMVQAELQGLYDEISQATLQFATASDIDQFHEVLYTPDWVFTDTAGHTRTWAEMRQEAVRALSAPRLDSMTQPIRTLSVDSGGATVVVNVITVHTIVDHEGRYGRPDASHTLTETTAFRDRWVRVLDKWKLKSRQQIGRPGESVDKPE